VAEVCDIRLIAGNQIIAEYEQATMSGGQCIVAFSLATADVARAGPFIAALSRIRRPGDLVIAGGPHPSAADEEVLSLGVDVVFRGEADSSFPRFVQAVASGHEWRNLPGLSFRAGSKVVRTPPPELIAMECLRSRFERMSLLGSFEITRGCPQACRFCQTPQLWGHKPRHRLLDNILDELAYYVRSHYVRFLSPNAFDYCAERPGEPNVRAIVEMLEAVRARYQTLRVIFGMFPSQVRPEYVRRELIRAIRPLVGNRTLAVGAQSGSDRILALAQRGHTVADVLRATEIILNEGMEALVDILFGLPGETADDVRRTRRLIEQIESLGGRLRVHLFFPMPGTPFADAAAGVLDEETRAFLNDMSARGAVEGTW
jgi:B12-binding domain/radical SAM domain protein